MNEALDQAVIIAITDETEQSMLEQTPDLLNKIVTIKKMGISIAIDDFEGKLAQSI